MQVPLATLKPKEERRLLRGHHWAFRNEFSQIPELNSGDLVDVVAANRRFVGRGFYQSEGGIAVRLLSSHQEDINQEFFERRIREARQLRETIFPGQSIYRWVFGESDGLSGLAADRYDTVVAVHTTCAFYESRAEMLAQSFLNTPGVQGVFFQFRPGTQCVGTVPDELILSLDGLQIGVDLKLGQKTGMFLDQRLNSLAMRPFAKNARVLDGHSYIGLWSCHAAQAGAVSVLGVDRSEKAIEQARANAERNHVSARCQFECADIEAVLARGDSYNLIMLDPPALAKSRIHLTKALSRYQALNTNAMKALEPGGILITSSCSHFVDMSAFLEMLKRAASGAGRQAQLLEFRGAPPDHPILLSMPETAYLKCALLRIF
ncbi:MAG TPA: class I SAM-dependent rRNA methyltransferase [Candidatus Hydrogenedentes bacterium]|nr:class I SAM-dependent rRNA methyltransferase [Candidatus Hydrogenedentota bacterium]